jgi:hypothetical protein
MVRILIGIVLFAGIALPGFATELQGGHKFDLGLELGYVNASGYESWTEGSVGKLRDNESGARISRAFLDFTGKLADTLDARVALEAYDDDLGNTIDFTQAYLEWRPVPRSPTRYRLKVGAFYPRISLENVDPGWSSPYTLNSSAINTWVAEELRSVGAELSISRRPLRLHGVHEFSIHASVFQGSDPAGSLLAWKGWSIHDRQTRYSDELPLPPLPQIQPDMMFAAQDPYVTPLREVDGRTGFYVTADWKYRRTFMLRVGHYDNRANPEKLVSGQYGWTTWFDHVGFQATLPGEVGLIGQWMSGYTVMGPVINGAHAVDVEYESFFLLLTRVFGDHRIAARYDNFDITQNDRTPEDNNPEYGLGWTLSYQYQMSQSVGLVAEWLSIKTHHCGWIYYGLDPTKIERQLQFSLKLRF